MTHLNVNRQAYRCTAHRVFPGSRLPAMLESNYPTITLPICREVRGCPLLVSFRASVGPPTIFSASLFVVQSAMRCSAGCLYMIVSLRDSSPLAQSDNRASSINRVAMTDLSACTVAMR